MEVFESGSMDRQGDERAVSRSPRPVGKERFGILVSLPIHLMPLPSWYASSLTATRRCTFATKPDPGTMVCVTRQILTGGGQVGHARWSCAIADPACVDHWLSG